jgi:hypothetical protein
MTYFFRKTDVIRTLLSALVCYAPGLSADTSSCYLPDCCPASFCEHVFIEGEFLYWRAYQGGLDGCISMENSDETTQNGEVISRFKGKKNDPHFQWRPGYRVGVGFLSDSCWDMAAYWTNFHSRAEGNRSCAQDQRWKLDFQVVDVLVGYKFCVQSCFTFRPFIGVRGAKIDQSVKALQSRAFLSSHVGEHNKEQFSGVGPLFGIEGNVNLGYGFSLYADAATSILYGNYNVNLRKLDLFRGGASFSYLKQRLNGYQTVFDAGIGIAFEACLCSNMRLYMKLGAEHHSYFDFNRLGSHGDLSLDGGSFSAAISF